MTKFLNKSMRKFHRWLALPFLVLFLLVLVGRDTPLGWVAQRSQQILMLTLLITGLYLFLLPYWARWRKRAKGNP